MSKILENVNNNTNSQNASTSSESQEPNLMNILGSVLTPLIPVVVAKLTGQKLPANSLSNSQPDLQQITPLLQSMINTQNILLQEIAVLKKNDQSIANSFQSLRLTHEKKSVELNTNQNANDHE